MSALLEVQGIGSGYGDVPVLSDVSLSVGADEIVSVVGANGAGKTTLLSTISGLLPCTAGTIRFDGEQIERLPAHDVVTRRLVMVPEGGRLFPFMTVLENLELGAFNASARPNLKASLDDVLAHFPILAERRQQLAGSLSGGERQMCAIARAMMSQPKLLMLDEPSLGLSPQMVERVFELILSLAREEEYRGAAGRAECRRRARHGEPRLHHRTRARDQIRHRRRAARGPGRAARLSRALGPHEQADRHRDRRQPRQGGGEGVVGRA